MSEISEHRIHDNGLQWCAKCKQWTVPEVATARYIAGVVSGHYYACPLCGWPTCEEAQGGLAPDPSG